MSKEKLNWDSFIEYFRPHQYLSFEGVTHELIIDSKMHKITLTHNDKERQHSIMEVEKISNLYYALDEENKILKVFDENNKEKFHFDYLSHFRYNAF
jgi:hypothetical protein